MIMDEVQTWCAAEKSTDISASKLNMSPDKAINDIMIWDRISNLTSIHIKIPFGYYL